MKKTYFAFLLVLCACADMVAQETPVTKRDSLQMYRDIEAYSKRSTISKFIYKLLFKSIPDQKTAIKTLERKKKYKSPYAPFENKTIRKITIETLDPFGYSVTNIEELPKNWFERFGNRVHAKSKNWTIRNFLLFKRNDTFDSIIIKESERLLQSERFIRRALIIPQKTIYSDSVDVTIRVLDSWSLIPQGAVSSSKSNLELTERNFLGLGHELGADYKKQFDGGQNGYVFRYVVPNFKNTFIRTAGTYTEDFDGSYIKDINTERTFFSPLTRYAGGIAFQERFYRDSIPDTNNVRFSQPFRYENQNYWAGYSLPLFTSKKEESRITNLVTTVRYSRTTFTMRPDTAIDTLNYYSNSRLYLGSIGINRRKFIEDSYLFNYGIPEYVQTGQSVSVTGGFEDKNDNRRSYFGGRYALGDYFIVGYLGMSAELGSFLNRGKAEQTTYRLTLNYFTNIIEMGNWKIRQFVQPQLVIGDNRFPIKEDRISINNEYGIQGFSGSLLGTEKLMVSLQTQSYAPGVFWGFRFSPFLNATLAMVGDDDHALFKSPLYSKFGLGVLISNDYLVFNNFQLSLAFYPKIPGEGDNVLKTNSFKNDDLRLIDYQIGQPTIVPYN